uniref:Uncharacterized protein n=1 Tax=Grammatophora oceanica TaxID=210454 RepID=A0A7S1VNY3_9STRA|mmetsp:Transcript_50278/g.75082  ORF Transcript_50278/g.75082 Transcript_50278/m.75082 type:complete len:271 (+) Transcript_50278:21-833(+)
MKSSRCVECMAVLVPLILPLTSGLTLSSGIKNHRPKQPPQSRRDLLTTAFTSAFGSGLAGAFLFPTVASAAQATGGSKFQRYPQIRFIAALGDPKASSGTGADQWGLWRDDPGPRGVFLRDYERQIVNKQGVAPAGWTFDRNDWWLEEHGLIMGPPGPLQRKRLNRETQEMIPFKRYVVTGDREVTTVQKVFEDGKWELAKGTLYDVTHLPCRSARYTSTADGGGSTCSPSNADRSQFQVKPGAVMPTVPGCNKQDYAVLFVLGEEAGFG